MNSYILSMIFTLSAQYGVDPHLVMNIIKVESGYNASAMGEKNERGLMQLNPKSFPSYSPSQLAYTPTNLKLGIKYLAEVKKYCKYKDYNTFVVCYNRGVTGGSKIKNPFQDKYYQSVMGKR